MARHRLRRLRPPPGAPGPPPPGRPAHPVRRRSGPGAGGEGGGVRPLAPSAPPLGSSKPKSKKVGLVDQPVAVADSSVESADQSEALRTRMSEISLLADVCDVMFVVGPDRVRLYSTQAMLGHVSPVFRERFRNRENPVFEHWFVIEDPLTCSPVMESMLDFVHGKRVEFKGDLNSSSLRDLLRVAHLYELHGFLETLVSHSKLTISHDNVAWIWEVAMGFDSDFLLDACMDHILSNAAVLLQAESFLKNASFDLIEDLMSRDELVVPENQLYRSVLSWSAQHAADSAQRRKLLACIRLPLMQTTELLNQVLPEGFFLEDVIQALAIQADKVNFTDPARIRK